MGAEMGRTNPAPQPCVVMVSAVLLVIPVLQLMVSGVVLVVPAVLFLVPVLLRVVHVVRLLVSRHGSITD